LFVQIELLLVVLAGFILVTTAETGLPETTDVLLSTVMIVMTVGVMALFAFMAIMNLRKIIRGHLRKRAAAKEEAELKAEEEATTAAYVITSHLSVVFHVYSIMMYMYVCVEQWWRCTNNRWSRKC
jgi:hypothetical protein